MRQASFRSRAFSLVEVVLALGIAAFALVAIVGMLPVGLKLASESDEESRAVNILTQLAADRRASITTAASEIYRIPALVGSVTATNTFAVGEDGTYLDQDFAKARYRVNYSLIPPRANSGDPWLLWLRAGWPAQATNPSASVESLNTIPIL
jgi:uncharacterized protein (TIGR02598 family)